MSLTASFYAVLFPRDAFDEIWDLTELVSEGFPSYSLIYSGHVHLVWLFACIFFCKSEYLMMA